MPTLMISGAVRIVNGDGGIWILNAKEQLVDFGFGGDETEGHVFDLKKSLMQPEGNLQTYFLKTEKRNWIFIFL